MIQLPFNMLVAGITNCGKTKFVLDFIQDNFKFENIVLFCPTFMENKTYRHQLANQTNFVVELLKTHSLDQALKNYYTIYKNSNTLFLLDDIANLWDSKHKCSELCRLAFSARHSGISVWVLTQKYNGIVKDFRDNIRVLVLFYNKDRIAMEEALKENNLIPKEKISDILDVLKNTKHSKLIMILEHPFKYTLLNERGQQIG